MIREHTNLLRKLLIAGDLLVVVISFFLAYAIRKSAQHLFPIKTYLNLLPVLLIIWGFSLHWFRMHQSFRMMSLPHILFNLLKATLTSFVIFGSFTYVLKLHYISRSFTAFMFVTIFVLLALSRIILVEVFRQLRKKGYNFRSVLLIGSGKRAQSFINRLEQHAEWGIKILGLVDEDAGKIGQTIKGYSIIGCFLDIPNILHNNIIDEVVFVVPRSWLGKIEEIIRFIELEGIKVSIAVDIFDLKDAKTIQTDIDGYPLITFERTPGRLWQLIIKRGIDIVLSFFGLIVFSPVFLTVSLIVKKTSPGPVFFRQMRCGMNGRRFILYKFRTMVIDAESKLEELLLQNEMKGPAFKMENDPRVTRIGHFLRKSSLDELPQLWNVLKGDMSLVGPRPPIPSEVQKYDNWQRRRLSMRPGITCLWQIQGRNKIIDFNEWANLDLKYIDTWSIWLDLRILFLTLPAVLFAKGAK